MKAKRMIQVIKQEFSVCRLAEGLVKTDENKAGGIGPSNLAEFCASLEICFIGKTDEELSLVCPTESAPDSGWEREDGWKAFRLQGVLDFSLIGILAELSSVLAEGNIGIFAVSTFNTDYILVKEEDFDRALVLLRVAGYQVLE